MSQAYHGRQNAGNAGDIALLAAIILLVVTAQLCLWVFPGVRFSGFLCMGLAGACLLLLLLRRWAAVSQAGRLCLRVFWILGGTGLLLFCLVEGLLLSKGAQDNRAIPPDAVIVLGAGVNGSTPSWILQSRINTAADYICLYPEIPVVLSGGQGPGENITEAEAMRRGLSAKGVDVPEEYLILEDTSTSTAENFAHSKALLLARGMDLETAVIAVVTNDFHCFRAHLIAQRADLGTILDIAAPTPHPALAVNYYTREFFALGKTLVFDR